MPREWHDRYAVARMEDQSKVEFYYNIVADKKPYFMRYVYPTLMKQYNTYIKNTNKNAMREFQLTIEELYAIPEAERTERMNEFLEYYESRMPVGAHDCVMNRICRRFEDKFDGHIPFRGSKGEFDYTIMKSGAKYNQTQYNAVLKLYENYNRRLRSYVVFANYERVDEYEAGAVMQELRDEFERLCAVACPNRYALCDIVLDICYQRNSTKRFAWEMCGDEIIQNLLVRNDGVISYPAKDESGELYFCGERFTVKHTEIGGDL